MEKVDRLWFKLVSEVLVNLSAGWVGIALAVPFASDKEALVKFGLLTTNFVAAIVSLVAAFRLRKKRREKMIDFADFNVKLLIAYALFLIVGLLIYIAFYKGSKGSSRQK